MRRSNGRAGECALALSVAAALECRCHSRGRCTRLEGIIAKARKKTRKAAAKRSTKKTKRGAVTTKSKTKSRAKKASKPKKRRAKAAKPGPIASAVDAVIDTIRGTGTLHNRLGGRNTFED